MNTLERNEFATNKAASQLDRAIVNGMQEKLFRLELNYAKRLKVQEICFKKKLDDLQRTFKELSSEMEVRSVCSRINSIKSRGSKCAILEQMKIFWAMFAFLRLFAPVSTILKYFRLFLSFLDFFKTIFDHFPRSSRPFLYHFRLNSLIAMKN